MKKYIRITDLRTDLDLSQEKIATLLNKSKTQYQRYENSVGNKFFDAMIEIAKFHKVSLDYIAGLTNDKGGLHKNSADEQKLIDIYNNLSEKGKGKLELFAEQLEKAEQKEKAKP